jgi:hypothetical protein
MTGMSVTDPRREGLCGVCRRAVDSGGYCQTRSRGVIDGSEGFRRSGTAERSRYLDPDPVMRIVKSSRVNKPGSRSDDDGDDEEDRQVARAGGRQQRYVCVCCVYVGVVCVRVGVYVSL